MRWQSEGVPSQNLYRPGLEAAMQEQAQMMKRLQVLADFGDFTLRSETLDEILTEACRLVAAALGTSRAKVLEIQQGEQCLLVRAGVGWDPEIIGHERLPMGEHSSETFAIRAAEPVISQDVNSDDRFDIPAFMKKAGVVALANVPIFLPGRRPYGLLQVDAAEPRTFGPEDTHFLRTYATILGPVIDRLLQARDLRASQERFRLTVEAARDYAIFASDTQDRITDWLPGAAAVFGWTAEEVLGRPAAMTFTPEDREQGQDRKEIETAAAEGVAANVRWHLRKDGSRVFIEGSTRALRDHDGTLTGFLKIGQDVTERRRVEQELRGSEERFRALVGATADVVYRMSPDWNEMRQLDGNGFLSDTASPSGTWLDQYIHPDDRPHVQAAIAEAIRTRSHFELEHRVRRADGRLGWTLSRAVPLLDGDGEIREWFGAATDIDDQVRAREMLARSHQELEMRVAERTAALQLAMTSLHQEVLERQETEERLLQSEKLKAIGQLTGGIAHDFNNMLQAVTSALSMIRSRLQQGRTTEIVGYVDRAEKGAQRAAALTHRLLAFGRRQTLVPKPVSLDRIARDMEDMIRRSVGPAVQVEFRLTSGRWLTMCDPSQLESALLNLSINARDAMPEGGWLVITTEELVLSEAEIASSEDAQPGRYASIAVADSGTGMTHELAARVFEPFFTTKPPGQGTGLGLSQIYGFIRQSGGIVQLETVPGKGTTIRLCLPFHALNPDAGTIAAIDNGRTVLLIEDEEDVREMTAEQLRDLGYRVLEAQNGPAALRLVQAGTHLDLLVSDIGLPGGMNGRQVADAVRERHPDLPVILISGYAAGQEMHGMDVLTKPFDPATLADMVMARTEQSGRIGRSHG